MSEHKFVFIHPMTSKLVNERECISYEVEKGSDKEGLLRRKINEFLERSKMVDENNEWNIEVLFDSNNYSEEN